MAISFGPLLCCFIYDLQIDRGKAPHRPLRYRFLREIYVKSVTFLKESLWHFVRGGNSQSNRKKLNRF